MKRGLSQLATSRRARRKPPRTADAIPETGKQSTRRRLIIIVSVAAVVIGLAISLSIYFIQIRPLQRPIIKVNDSAISIGYLIRRLEASVSTDIFAMIQVLTDEELIRQAGPRMGIEVTDEEIDEMLHMVARGENESISDAEFQNWYRLQLNESRMDDTEFREFWRVVILSGRIQEIEAAKVPAVAEQVRLSYLVTESYEAAEASYNRLEEGEAFADVAADVSVDPGAVENGGDMGWFPEAALGDRARFTFRLAVGEYSRPVPLTDDNSVFALFLVTDRAASRDIDEDKMQLVHAGVLREWLSGQAAQNEITFHGMDWSEQAGRYTFGNETQAWISWQLAKRASVNRQAEQ